MPISNVKIIPRDLGWNAVMREINRMKGSHTKVGFPSEGTVHNVGEGEQYSDMSEVATIAAVHEFGAPARHIPERSFLRSGIDENRPALQEKQAKVAGLVLDGRMTVDRALGILGEFAKGRIQAKITSGPFEALSQRTIDARTRPSTKPLIDTGSMRQTVQHVEVING